MRVIAGRLGGRRFGRVASPTRPTSDRVREAIASALDSRGLLEDARVLDLYAGTGALAFEALSRGATHATLVERDSTACKGIAESAHELGLSDQVTLKRLDVERPAGQHAVAALGPFTLVFADPPYAAIQAARAALAALGRSGAFAEGAVLVLERGDAVLGASGDAFDAVFDSLAGYRYGSTHVDFFALRARMGDDPAP